DLVSFGNTLYFISAGVSPAQLWKSDGTSGGTVAVTDAALLGAGAAADSLSVTNGTLLLVTSAAGQPAPLRRSDGTRQGTTLIDSVPFVASPVLATAKRAYFSSQGRDLPDDANLWASDGTSAGSALALNFGQGDAAIAFADFSGSAAVQFVAPVGGPALW